MSTDYEEILALIEQDRNRFSRRHPLVNLTLWYLGSVVPVAFLCGWLHVPALLAMVIGASAGCVGVLLGRG